MSDLSPPTSLHTNGQSSHVSLIRRAQDQFAGVTFAVCSVDGAPGQEKLAALHGIQVLPTCILFQGGSEVARVAGCSHKRPGKAVYDMLSKAIF